MTARNRNCGYGPPTGMPGCVRQDFPPGSLQAIIDRVPLRCDRPHIPDAVQWTEAEPAEDPLQEQGKRFVDAVNHLGFHRNRSCGCARVRWVFTLPSNTLLPATSARRFQVIQRFKLTNHEIFIVPQVAKAL